MKGLYETDFAAWAARSAELLGAGRFDELDVEHVIEEIRDLGIAEYHALESHMENLIAHLLKYEHQSAKRSKSWTRTILNSRSRIRRILRRSPSLQAYLCEAIENAYPDAVRLSAHDTSMDRSEFPAACPYTLEQLLDQDYLP